MILAEIRDYIQLRQRVSLEDIMNHFDLDEDTARAMLKLWVDKRKIYCQNLTVSCQSQCRQCHQNVTEIYVWGQQHGVNKAYMNGFCQVKQ